MAIALAVFALDLVQPLGVAAGVPYILPVLVCLSTKQASYTYWIAALGSVLTIAGFFLSADGAVLWMVLVNRGLAILAIWTVTIFGVRMFREISLRTVAEYDLFREKQQSAQFLNIAANIMVVLDKRGYITLLNRAGCNLLECDESEALGLNWFDNFIPADRRDLARSDYQRAMNGEIARPGETESEIVTASGGRKLVRWFDVIVRDDEGNIKGTLGSGEDITERRRAERSLKESEAHLRQSQKMEAVGQLTGGVAHDFNNLLAIIEGNLSLLEDDLDEGRSLSTEELKESVLPALRASRRGAELTHRLLAFSRKQVLQPVALDINSIVQGMESLLRRTLSEDIDLGFHLACDGWLAEADVAELENVLLNLALNARDAMPAGGRLTIETAEVTLDDGYAASHAEVRAGEYVLLAVTDTGTGMNAETLDKVFEPFFTTKGVGRGTGLGLSMVHGFVKQSGGNVTIYSEPGEGTTVKLYLPRTAVTEADAIQRNPTAVLVGGHESILVVEDDENVGRTIMRILARLGYKVSIAGDGQAALNILRGENHVDLLLTDVILPDGMSGPDVVKVVSEKMTDLKVLFMSGYTENAIVHQGRLDDGVNLIGKPFSHVDLGVKVRQVLDTAP